MTIYCSKCGAANEDFAEFCASCGEPTASARETKEKGETNFSHQESTHTSTQLNQERKLYRSRKNKILTGLSAGLAEHYNMDVDIIRVLWIIATFVSGGIVILIYFIMALIIPIEPKNILETENKDK
ncbi:MAG: PspC domain-containing protein [Candidatus Heimdallarchaeota archaeon]|nr:PspC domain-containing protein [Candidatus Heimdallarchaeota archaeon]